MLNFIAWPAVLSLVIFAAFSAFTLPVPVPLEEGGAAPQTDGNQTLDYGTVEPLESLTNDKAGYDCKDLSFINQTSGVLYSPRYPNDYPNSAICVYSIQVPVGNEVELAVYDLATEPCCDKLRVYDGDATTNKSAKLIETLAGSLKPKTLLRSSGPSMTLNFTTDPEETYRGFYARFDAVPDNNKRNPSHTACPLDTNFNSAWGVFTAPLWPNDYPSMADCHYYINVEKGKRIRLHVNYFHTEACCDILKVYDRSVGLQAGQEYRNMSGWLAEGHTVVSKSNQLVLRFISDIENEMEGFSITYTTVEG